jgi:hypothetical protein
VIWGHHSFKLIIINVNIIELIVSGTSGGHCWTFLRGKGLIGDLTRFSVLHIS